MYPYRGYIVLFLLLVVSSLSLDAQTDRSRTAIFAPIQAGDSVKLDSLTLEPGSLALTFWRNGDDQNGLPNQEFDFDVLHSTIVWLTDADSAQVSYRVYPIFLGQRKFLRDVKSLDSVDILIRPITEIGGEQNDGWPELSGLDYNGSFSRGLSFGNKQDVVLNSSLNLQLAGKLRDDIEINAAITDNSIPIQPDGNTAQLQEFDKVYIGLSKDEQRLIVGDLQLNRPDAYFMNFFKRLQGGSYTGAFNQKGKTEIAASVAVAKGQYRKQQLLVQEGNQGPYKLSGNSGERFIIVLAGTERVFVDGRLLSRGTENDYVIDYNAGEISFTPKLLVTKDVRIFVEFQYSDQNYFRSLVFGQAAYTTPNDRLKFSVAVYSEQDGKNQSIDQDLGSAERSILEAVGDSLNQAFIPGIDSVAFDPDRILYRKTDSLGFSDVYVYSTSNELARYQLSFSEVGQGNGNYRQLLSSANGRVYEWVSPLAGVPQGNFEPVRLLVAPEKIQLLTTGISIQTGKLVNGPTKAKQTSGTATDQVYKGGLLTAEVGLSQLDRNTFSPADDSDDAGLALKIGIQQPLLTFGRKTAANKVVSDQATSNQATNTQSTDQASSNQAATNQVISDQLAREWKLVLEGSYEFADSRFRPIERYRTVEFERDWNILAVSLEPLDEHIASAGLSMIQTNGNGIGYRLGTFQRGDAYNGIRQTAFANYRRNGIRLVADASLLGAKTDTTDSRFFRPKFDLSQTFKKGKGWTIGTKAELEDNQFSTLSSDSLSGGTFYYDQWGVYLSSPDSSTLSHTMQYIRRRDKRALNGELALASVSDNYSIIGNWFSKTNQRLGWNLTYRQLEVADTTIARAAAEQSILGRLEYGGSFKRGLLRTDLVYQLGSGQELRREYTYLQVPAGEGNYSWIDYNGNGVAELDEFEQAAFTDQANYIRVLVPGNDFIRANLLQFSYSLGLNPASIWFNEKGLKGAIARLALQSSWQLNRKLLDGAGSSTWLPTDFDSPDTSLVSLTSFFRQSLFFNRGKSNFGMEYSWQHSQNRNIITNGTEDRLKREHILTTRWAPGGNFFTKTILKTGQQELISAAFSNRNYRLPFYELAPELTYQTGTSKRLSLKYRFKKSENELATETLALHELGLEGRFKLVNKSSLEASLSWITAGYAGEDDSPVGFAMLEGLQDGTNYLWAVTYDRKLSRFVQLSLQYEGRKTGLAAINHVGRAQLRAIF